MKSKGININIVYNNYAKYTYIDYTGTYTCLASIDAPIHFLCILDRVTGVRPPLPHLPRQLNTWRGNTINNYYSMCISVWILLGYLQNHIALWYHWYVIIKFIRLIALFVCLYKYNYLISSPKVSQTHWNHIQLCPLIHSVLYCCLKQPRTVATLTNKQEINKCTRKLIDCSLWIL